MIPENNQNNVPQTDIEKKYVKFHQHLSTAFIIVGIVSFTLGAIVNWETIKRLSAQK